MVKVQDLKCAKPRNRKRKRKESASEFHTTCHASFFFSLKCLGSRLDSGSLSDSDSFRNNFTNGVRLGGSRSTIWCLCFGGSCRGGRGNLFGNSSGRDNLLGFSFLSLTSLASSTYEASQQPRLGNRGCTGLGRRRLALLGIRLDIISLLLLLERREEA